MNALIIAAVITTLLVLANLLVPDNDHQSSVNTPSNNVRQMVHGDVIVSRIKTVQKSDQSYQLANNYALAPTLQSLTGLPPAFTDSMSLGGGAGPAGLTRWDCFFATVYPYENEAFVSARKKLGASAVVSASCGSSVDSVPLPRKDTPVILALTYWYKPLVAPSSPTPVTPPSTGTVLDLSQVTQLFVWGSFMVASGTGTMPSWCVNGQQSANCPKGKNKHEHKGSSCTESFVCFLPVGSACSTSTSSGAMSCVAP